MFASRAVCEVRLPAANLFAWTPTYLWSLFNHDSNQISDNNTPMTWNTSRNNWQTTRGAGKGLELRRKTLDVILNIVGCSHQLCSITIQARQPAAPNTNPQNAWLCILSNKPKYHIPAAHLPGIARHTMTREPPGDIIFCSPFAGLLPALLI